MSLRIRFILTLGVGGVVTLFIITLLVFNRMELAMGGQLRRQFEGDIQSRFAGLNHTLADLGEGFQLAAKLPMFKSLRYHRLTLNEPAYRNDIRYLELYYLDFLEEWSPVLEVSLVDREGRELLRVDRSGIRGNLADLSLDETVSRMVGLRAGDFRISEGRVGGKLERLVWWLPVSGSSSVENGVLAFSVGLGYIEARVRELLYTEGEEVCLGDPLGGVIFSNAGRESCEPRGEPGSDMVLRKKVELALPGLSWALSLSVSPDVFLADVKGIRRVVFGIILPVVGVVAFALALLFSNHFARAIGQIVDGARLMGRGGRYVPIEMARGDELGELAREVNRSAALIEENRDRLEELVEERTTKLVAINKELEAFAYSVSHDLRAPLRHIDGFSQALLEDYGDKLDEEGRDYLHELSSGATEMGELIDSLLALSRITRREIKREEIDLGELARSSFEVLKKGYPKRRVAFKAGEGIWARGDLKLVGVLIQNLLENALKYTEKREDGRIEFGRKLEGGEEVFYLRDNGAGFDMNYYGKLFGAFQRLHTESEFKGTGIGLATAQRIINRHGGRIWAEGEVERGATFYFTLEQGRSNGGG